MANYYPPRAFHFKVEVIGLAPSDLDVRFTEVGGLAMELATEEVPEGGENRFSGALLSSHMLRIKTGKRSMWSVKLAVRWNLRHGKAGDYVLDDADDPFDHTFEKDALTSDESRYEQWRQQLYACPHLAVGGPTWGWLAVGLDAGERSLKPKALKAVSIPVAIVALPG